MPLRPRRQQRPLPAAATAVEVAAYKTAELMDNALDLLDDYREWGKVPIDFRVGGIIGKFLGEELGLDIRLPPIGSEAAAE